MWFNLNWGGGEFNLDWGQVNWGSIWTGVDKKTHFFAYLIQELLKKVKLLWITC